MIIKHNKGGNQLEIVDIQVVKRFLTQILYEQSCIRNWGHDDKKINTMLLSRNLVLIKMVKLLEVLQKILSNKQK